MRISDWSSDVCSSDLKGGLFHHFPNKQALVEGVLADQFEKLDAVLDDIIAADRLPYGRFKRAYVTLIFDHPRARSPWATLAGMLIADPAIRARWATWIAERLARPAAPARGLALGRRSGRARRGLYV